MRKALEQDPASAHWEVKPMVHSHSLKCSSKAKCMYQEQEAQLGPGRQDPVSSVFLCCWYLTDVLLEPGNNKEEYKLSEKDKFLLTSHL